MWHDIFGLDVPAGEKILRTVLVYALILLIFRIVGKRTISSLSTLDFAVMFLLSNIVQNAIIGNDNSFSGGAIGAVTLVVVNTAVNRLAYQFPWFRALVEGTPTEVVHHGRLDERALRRLGMRRAELEHAIRLQSGDGVGEVWSGVLEPGGELVMTLKDDEQSATQADVQRILDRLDELERRWADPAGAAPGH